jgi:hypothetical protein
MQERSTLNSLILAASLPLAALAAGVQADAATTPEGRAVVQAAQAVAAKALKQPVTVVPDTVKLAGTWAFVVGQMQTAQGKPIDYTGTRWEQAAKEGGVSRLVVVLLRRSQDGGWRTVDHLVGPTDVAWSDWATKHGAPAALFSS